MFDWQALRERSPQDVAKALGMSVGRVYLVRHRLGALVKKETRRLEAREFA
ncbi:MAG: hypothetical protein AAB466_06860 [Verrucomicrobiota bacterium]